MLHFLIHRPIAVLTTLLGLVALGGIVATQLPISLLPETAIPQITVQLSYANASAQELEQTITQPLRNQLLQVNQLKDVQSRTQNGSATIVLDFEYGTNTNLAFIEVNEKIDQISSLLPREMERPRVLKAGVTDVPVFFLSVVPKDGQSDALELAEFTQSVLKRRIEQLEEVAFVDVSGYAEPEIVLLPRREVMQSLGLTERDLERILQVNNLNLGSILLQDGQYQYNLRFRSELRSREDMEGIFFNHQGQVLPLTAIADIRLQPQQARGKYLYNDREAIVLSIRKQADAQLFALKATFDELRSTFQHDYPQLDFYVSNDQSELLEVSIDNLRTSLLYGAFFAAIILFLFFRGWRAPVLITIAIPISLVIALLSFYLLDISINVISLSGLILGVGLMIDNSIIVMENVQQYRQMGYGRTEACVRGTNEVIRPLISSALTTCSVFLPLIFLSGLAGALFYDQAVSISIALGASLLVAYVLLPTLLRLLGTPEEEKERQVESHAHSIDTRGYKSYIRSVDIALRFRGLTILLFIGCVAATWWLLQELPQETFPKLSRTALAVDIDWNEPVTVDENERRLAELLRQFESEIQFSNAFVGEQQFLLEQERQSTNQAGLFVFLEQEPERFAPALRNYLQTNFPRAAFRVEPIKTIFDEVFGAEKAPLILHLQETASNQMPSPERALPFIQFLTEQGIPVTLPPLQEQYEISIRREQALIYDVAYETIYQKLRTIFNDYHIGMLRAANDFIPILVGAEQETLYQRVQEAQLSNSKGQLLPLSAFIHIQTGQYYKTITAGKSGVALGVDLPFYSDSLQTGIRQFLQQSRTLTGYFSGQVFENQKVVGELSVILGVSVLLLYLILAAQFESLVQPLLVISTVPIGLAGAIVTLWLAGQSINLISIIGMIVMSGIVVNDAILKVDMMNRLSKESLPEEAIHGAGIRRLKPILMTTLTTILALLPVLFTSGLGAELQRPLAFAVIGGLTVGTISSLYFVPLLWYVLEKIKGRKRTSMR